MGGTQDTTGDTETKTQAHGKTITDGNDINVKEMKGETPVLDTNPHYKTISKKPDVPVTPVAHTVQKFEVAGLKPTCGF